MDTPIADQVIEQLKTLSYDLQWRVLEFTRALALSTPHGVPGQLHAAAPERHLDRFDAQPAGKTSHAFTPYLSSG
jgi:hypothetical protein